MPRCDWVYFATPTQEEWSDTRSIVRDCGMIIRAAYNSNGLAIANAKQIKVGDTILLAYGGRRKGRSYRSMLLCQAIQPRHPIPGFDAFTEADPAQRQQLEKSEYPRDPHLGKYRGIAIRVTGDLSAVTTEIRRPAGNNTIRRWSEVFANG